MEHRAKMGKRNYLLVGYVISDSVDADYSYHSIIMYHYHSPFTFMSIVHSIDFAELPFSQCLSRNKLSKWLNWRSIHPEAFHKKLFREISQNLQTPEIVSEMNLKCSIRFLSFSSLNLNKCLATGYFQNQRAIIIAQN